MRGRDKFTARAVRELERLGGLGLSGERLARDRGSGVPYRRRTCQGLFNRLFVAWVGMMSSWMERLSVRGVPTEGSGSRPAMAPAGGPRRVIAQSPR
jgi:hypothetical protein